MSEDKKEELITDILDEPDFPEDRKPAKKLSFITKFFLFAFTVLLIFHFVTNWIATEKIDKQADQLSQLNKELSDLKLQNQELVGKVKNLESELAKAKTNLEYVDTERSKKAAEINELNKILSTMKTNVPEGSKLMIERLEKKLADWENYYKSLNETLKKRPAK
ncbi:MAG: hypothetical protein NE327_07380 [Lentisphaeraceae bacterium]|nr:hypothetical protein [Lentisphaeraceae bacterium]